MEAALVVAPDSARPGLLNALAGALARTEPQQALVYGRQAVAEARARGSVRQEGVAHYQVGLAHYALGSYAEAARAQRDAVDLLTQAGDEDILGYAYNHLGNAFAREENHEAAVDAYRNATRTHMASGDTAGQAFAHNNLGLLL